MKPIPAIVFAVILLLSPAAVAAYKVTWEDLQLQSDQLAAKGELPAALEFAQQALAEAGKASGPGNKNTVTSLRAISSIYRAQGDMALAETYMKKALAVRALIIGQEPLNRDYLDIYTLLKDLSGIYIAREKYRDALSCMERAVVLEEKVVGRKSPELSSDLKTLASLYKIVGKDARTEELYGKTVGIELDDPSSGPEVLYAALKDTAGLYIAEERWDEAEAALVKMVEVREEADGPYHSSLSGPFNDLARVYLRLGKLAQAEEAAKRALKIDERALPTYHPQLAKSLSNLATVYAYEGKYKESESLYERSLSIAEERFGKKSPESAAILENMASMYDRSGNAAKAKKTRKQMKEWGRAR